MNIALRLKTLAIYMSASLLFVASASYASQFTYVPSSLKVTLSNSGGQTDSLSFQQGGKLEVAGTTTNSTNVNIATTGAYGLPRGAGQQQLFNCHEQHSQYVARTGQFER